MHTWSSATFDFLDLVYGWDCLRDDDRNFDLCRWFFSVFGGDGSVASTSDSSPPSINVERAARSTLFWKLTGSPIINRSGISHSSLSICISAILDRFSYVSWLDTSHVTSLNCVILPILIGTGLAYRWKMTTQWLVIFSVAPNLWANHRHPFRLP